VAFIDTTYVDSAIGTSLRGALAPSTAAFNIYEKQARAAVQAAAQVAGYSIGNTSTNDMVQLLTLGQWFFFAAGMRKGIETPPAIQASIDKLAEVRDGRWPLPGLSPSTEDGVGGSKFSDTSETSTASRHAYFSRDKLRTW
jgi:hypothetical protein